jgi:hypothetical protein
MTPAAAAPEKPLSPNVKAALRAQAASIEWPDLASEAAAPIWKVGAGNASSQMYNAASLFTGNATMMKG